MRVMMMTILIGGLAMAGCDSAAPGTGAATGAAAAANVPSGTPAASDATVPSIGPAKDLKLNAPASVAGAATTARWRDITIPAGTTLPLILDTAVGSDTSRVEQRVEAHVARPVTIDGVTAIPADSLVTGVVTEAQRAGKVDGRAHVAFRFDTIAPLGQDQRYELATGTVGRTAPSEKKKDAAKIAVPAAGGAVIGAIVGGKKGAVIGGAVGGGAGTAVVLTDRGQEVRMGKGAAISLKLTGPLTVRVRS